MGDATAKRPILAGTIALATSVLIALAIAANLATAQSTADFEIPNGWFYTQTSTGDGTGFAVTDDDGIPYWTKFQELGGISTLGYPASRRFVYKGFTNQAFQKAILQWQPTTETVNFLNIFDELSALGKDAELKDTKLTPPSRDWSGDVGLAWNDVIQRHLSLLQENAAIAARFMANPDWLNHYGLPMGYEDLGDLRVLRAQRATFQQWMIDVPWAKVGEVVVANGGDIAKELGLMPNDAGIPHRFDEIPQVVSEATSTPVPVPTPTPGPTATPTPTAQPQLFSGRGKDVSPIFQLDDGLANFDLSHSGTSNFAIWLLDVEAGDRLDLLVNEIGSFSGSTVVSIDGSGSYILDITADGSWNIQVEQVATPATAPIAPLTISGRGQTASSFFFLDSGIAIFRMSHTGQSNFAIWLFRVSTGDRVDLLVNEIGAFSGSTITSVSSSGIYIMDVAADGNWSVDISR